MLAKGISLLSSLLVVVVFSASAQDAAEKAFADEVVQCAAYYDISSQVIGSMNAPQMKPVGERLKQSAEDAKKLAAQYMAQEKVAGTIEQAKEQQMAKLSAGANLGVLMRQYKELCKQVVYSPEQRLEYWAMATM